MSKLALRDHGRAILSAIAKDMETGQSESRSKGSDVVVGAPQTAAATNGALRQLAGFDLSQLVGEFRAMCPGDPACAGRS